MSVKNKQINEGYDIEEEEEGNLSLNLQSNEFFNDLYNY